MKYSILTSLLLSFIISGSSVAKFSGIPIRVAPPEPSTKEPEAEPEPDRYRQDSPPVLMTPAIVRRLLNAHKINEPLRGKEEDRLDELSHLFQKMAEHSDRDASELLTIVERSNLTRLSKTNLYAALFIGKVDAERRINEDDIILLRKISEQDTSLTYAVSRAFREALQRAEKNTPRSLRDDLRNVRLPRSDYRHTNR